ncbi:MAG: AAA family ATPase [Dehalococcoidia bacterium]
MTLEDWERFGSAVVEAEALERRLLDGPPRDFAGLVIEDDEVDRLLASLPGLAAPDERPPARADVTARLAELRARFHASLSSDDAFARLARSARLRPPDAEVFAVLAAIERSPARQRLLAFAQDDVSATRPWLGTITRLFPGEPGGIAALGEDAPLRRAEFVTVVGDGPWATRPVALAPRVTWALAGDQSVEPTVPHGTHVIEGPEHHGGRQEPHLLLVTGGDRTSRELEAGRALPGPFLAAPLPADDDGWRAVIREASARDAVVLFEVEEPRLSVPATFWIERAAHLTFVISSKTPIEIRTLPARPWSERAVKHRMATTEEWAERFGQRPERGHRLDPEALRLARVAHDALGDVDAAVRRLASGALDELATRIESRRSWDHLVLPRQQERQLRELVARYRHSATVFDRWGFNASANSGIVALFAGPSGTGKTLAAEVVGTALGLDVYKVDLSSLVSKYIGETEKNLERIFDAASAGNVVLFFDEADALFGKRSEVSDSHDRYANIEVAYLLQRIEAYDGIVVLATNLRANLDDAFLRRIHVSVDFRDPDEPQRLQIWQRSFPSVAPVDDLDLAWLAKTFRVTGGNIRNASTTAAFLAADADRAITMTDVVRGIDRELEKLGRLRTEADFGPYFRALSEE